MLGMCQKFGTAAKWGNLSENSMTTATTIQSTCKVIAALMTTDKIRDVFKVMANRIAKIEIAMNGPVNKHNHMAALVVSLAFGQVDVNIEITIISGDASIIADILAKARSVFRLL